MFTSTAGATGPQPLTASRVERTACHRFPSVCLTKKNTRQFRLSPWKAGLSGLDHDLHEAIGAGNEEGLSLVQRCYPNMYTS